MIWGVCDVLRPVTRGSSTGQDRFFRQTSTYITRLIKLADKPYEMCVCIAVGFESCTGTFGTRKAQFLVEEDSIHGCFLRVLFPPVLGDIPRSASVQEAYAEQYNDTLYKWRNQI